MYVPRDSCRAFWLSAIFFFQAEDGIRDIGVTGVQTCALPISKAGLATVFQTMRAPQNLDVWSAVMVGCHAWTRAGVVEGILRRSEERRVGKEGRSRWSPYH